MLASFSSRPRPGFRPLRPSPPAERLPTFAQLTPKQQAMLGPAGVRTYAGFSLKQRAVFAYITYAVERAGLALPGLLAECPRSFVRPNRVLFHFEDAASRDAFEAKLRQAVAEGRFLKDRPFALFHWDRADYGARQAVRKFSLEVGVGEDGAFVDVDRYNPRYGLTSLLLHGLELLVPGKPDPLKIAREQGIDLTRPAQDVFD